ncbi:tRNA 2-thiouridine(34) synthase MnmA [Candidatus Peregrinibacteria bacterium]|nr:tRNA 2-thiouridine(34) synthase MnmA [Candidatus Peregrinibacteria bacterium]
MKIALLLSGGVDSSVSLRLLQEQGHDVTAFYVKIWLEDELKYLGDCPWEEDLKYARAVCDQAGVRLQIMSLQKEYRKEVVAYTLRELKAGRTPNPDVLCNQRIKFGQFHKKIDKSFEKVATGHYAQVVARNSKLVTCNLLKRSPDPVKDQTYFLCHLSQKQVSRALFPIGHLTKSEVRKLAQKFDLPNKNRKDSQGICFLGQVRFSEFVQHHLGEKKGDLIEIETGKKVGEHNGYWYFTIGQRQGIGLSGGPWYVVKKNVRKNVVYVTRGRSSDERRVTSNEMQVTSDEFKIHSINWIARRLPKKREVTVRIRHGGELLPGRLTLHRDGSGTVRLKKAATGVAPGQFAALYDGKYCLGGGVIA